MCTALIRKRLLQSVQSYFKDVSNLTVVNLIPFLHSSKFGTKVSFDKETNEGDEKTPVNNDSETDDATDDEGAGASGLASSQFSAAPLLRQHPNQITKIVDRNGSIVLSTLSLRKDKERNGSAVIQVGTALFKVTRVPLEFCLSRLQAKEKKEMENLGREIGGSVTTTFDCDTITYLVSPDKSSTAKSMSAWALDVPTVTVEFLRAFAKRSKLDDPLPKYQDYEAPASESKIENELTPSKRRRILGGYKVLSLMPSEGEVMCQCTGAAIIPLYRTGDDGKIDYKFWQSDEFWEDLKKEQEEDSLVIVWLDTASKKLKKGRDYLIKYMKGTGKGESSCAISCVNQNGIARAISDGSNLKDVNEKELVPLKEFEDTPHGTSDPRESSSEQMETEVILEEATKESSIREQKTDGQSAIEDAEPDLQQPVRQKRSKNPDRSQNQSGWMNSSKSKSSTQGAESGWISTTQDLSKNSDDEHGTETYDVVETADVENVLHKNPSKRKTETNNLLQQTNDGWLRAAPQGKGRDRCKRSRAELTALGDAFLRDSAETIFCSNLQVAPPNREAHTDGARNPSNVKNFKKFKKNSIIAGAKMHSIAPITLVSVLPKESERQKELETMQNELDSEQRAADSLFTGNEGKKRREGIRNYFESGQASRGRSRKS